MKPIITATCYVLAGCLLTLASWERPETQATTAQPTITILEATPVIVTPAIAPDETVTPPLTPSVDAYTVVASASATGDCANGTCSAPRAASVRRYQPVTRRGLFGGRFFGRR